MGCSLEDLRLERLGATEHLRAVQRSFDDEIVRRVLAAEVPHVSLGLTQRPLPTYQLRTGTRCGTRTTYAQAMTMSSCHSADKDYNLLARTHVDVLPYPS